MLLSSAIVALGALLPYAHARPKSMVELETRQTNITCATGIHLMIAGGCKIPCNQGDEAGLLQDLINNITAAVPGTDQYFVPYNVSAPAAYATPLMIRAATEYVAACPSTPIVFIGYSVGGITIMNTLCGGVSPSLISNIIFASIYGEETYVGLQSYDKASCTLNAPNFPRNSTNVALCAPYAPVINSYCFNTDPNCCTNGTLPLAHFIYPNYFDAIVLANVTQSYSSWTSALATRMPTSTSTSTSTLTSSSSTATNSTSTARTVTPRVTLITKTFTVAHTKVKTPYTTTRTTTITRTVTPKPKPTTTV